MPSWKPCQKETKYPIISFIQLMHAQFPWEWQKIYQDLKSTFLRIKISKYFSLSYVISIHISATYALNAFWICRDLLFHKTTMSYQTWSKHIDYTIVLSFLIWHWGGRFPFKIDKNQENTGNNSFRWISFSG